MLASHIFNRNLNQFCKIREQMQHRSQSMAFVQKIKEAAQIKTNGSKDKRDCTQVTTNEEAFAEASSQLALAPPYTGDEEEDETEMEDNTEKREVSSTVGLNEVDDVDVHLKPISQSFIHLPNLQPVLHQDILPPPPFPNPQRHFQILKDISKSSKPFPNAQRHFQILKDISKYSKTFPNPQVILNSRQDRRSQGPPLPPDVLARIQVCHH